MYVIIWGCSFSKVLTAKIYRFLNYSYIGARLHLAPIYDQTNNILSITINIFENEQPHIEA